MPRIFIVEDNRDLQNLYKITFSLFNFEIIGSAFDGIEAVRMYKSFSEKPDIILMDHWMPIKNGLDVIREILQINNRPEIIFLSADLSVKEEALDLGVRKFFAKPFSMKDLIEEINKIENERRDFNTLK